MSEDKGNDDFVAQTKENYKRLPNGWRFLQQHDGGADINRKLDVALARIQEIEEIKEKERQMEKETVTQKKGLNLHISQLRNKLKEQILLRKPYPSLLKEFES